MVEFKVNWSGLHRASAQTHFGAAERLCLDADYNPTVGGCQCPSSRHTSVSRVCGRVHCHDYGDYIDRSLPLVIQRASLSHGDAVQLVRLCQSPNRHTKSGNTQCGRAFISEGTTEKKQSAEVVIVVLAGQPLIDLGAGHGEVR